MHQRVLQEEIQFWERTLAKIKDWHREKVQFGCGGSCQWLYCKTPTRIGWGILNTIFLNKQLQQEQEDVSEGEEHEEESIDSKDSDSGEEDTQINQQVPQGNGESNPELSSDEESVPATSGGIGIEGSTDDDQSNHSDVSQTIDPADIKQRVKKALQRKNKIKVKRNSGKSKMKNNEAREIMRYADWSCDLKQKGCTAWVYFFWHLPISIGLEVFQMWRSTEMLFCWRIVAANFQVRSRPFCLLFRQIRTNCGRAVVAWLLLCFSCS